MTDSSLDFDAIAADDALIEAIRSGATSEDVDTDPAAATLVALRDALEQPTAPAEPAPTPARASGTRRIPHRRIVATGLASCLLVTGGVGTAVAGDPAAAFRYLFHQGVELGSRVGTPDDSVNADPGSVGGASDHATMNTAPRQQGSAAAPRSDERGVGDRFGFERDARNQTMPTRKNLGPGVGNDQSFAGESDDPERDVRGDSGFEDFDSAPGSQLDDNENVEPRPYTPEQGSPETDDNSEPDHDDTNVGPTSDPTEEPSDEPDDESTEEPSEDPSDEPDDGPSTLLPTPPTSEPPSSSPTDPETPTEPTPTDPTQTSPTPPDPTSDPETPTAPSPTASTSPTPTDPTSATSPAPTPSETSEPTATPSDTVNTG